jgi:TolC family type I secretion outer membrane protein
MQIMKKLVVGFMFLSLLFAGSSLALTLKESIGVALKNNPSILAVQKKVDAADAKLQQAVGAFMPTVKIDASYGRSYTQPSTIQITQPTSMGAVTQNLQFGTDAQQDSKSLRASLNQPVFVAALFPGLKIAQKSADLAKEDLKKTILETSFNVTQAYFGVIRAEKMVKLSLESREMAQSHLNQVRTMVAAGVATQADLLRAKVQMANSEVVLTQAKNGLDIARDAFNNALGNDLEEEVKLKEEGFTGKVAAMPEYKNLLALSYDNRPDWKEYLLSKNIGEESLNIAQAAYYPTVMLSASTGNQVTEYPSFRSDVNSWAVTGAASLTLFDGFGIQNRIREAASNLEAQKATEEQIQNGIALEVRDSYLNLKSSLEMIDSAKKAVDSAEESRKVSSLRYSSGAGTNLEVLDAQVSLTQARINYLQALFNLEIAKAKINKVVGKEVF